MGMWRVIRAMALSAVLMSGAVRPMMAAEAPAAGWEQDAEKALMEVRAKLPFVSLGDFLYNRAPRDYSLDGKVTAAWRALDGLRAPALTLGALKAMTRHAEADIRMLALLGLVAQESPVAVEMSLNLLNDPSGTIPQHQEFGGRLPGEHEIYTKPQTVGEVARAILTMCEGRIELNADRTMSVAPSPEAWWQARKDNAGWLGWQRFMLNRANHGTSPLQETARADMRRFRDKLEALSPIEKSWTLLYLADDVLMSTGEWIADLCTEEELIHAIQALGADALVEFLRSGKRSGLREPALDLPDPGRRTILRHARRLFSPAQAEALLKLRLFTTAADADPRLLHRAVKEGMRHHQQEYHGSERACLMAALACLSEAEADRQEAIEWLYSEREDRGYSQGTFINEVARRRPGHWRELVQGVVRHPDFQLLAPQNVTSLARCVERLGGEKILPPTYRYHEDADGMRDQLRERFQGAPSMDRLLEIPVQFLPEPEWTVRQKERGLCLEVSTDGRLLAVAMNEKPEVHLLETASGTEGRRMSLPGKYYNRDAKVRFFAPDDTLRMVMSSMLGILPQAGNADSTLQTQGLPTNIDGVLTAEKHAGLRALSLIDDHVACTDLKTGETLWRRKQASGYHKITISPDEKRLLITDGWGPELLLLDSSTGNTLHRLSGHAGELSRAAFSADSRLLVTTAEDNRVFIWNVAEGTVVSRYRGHGVSPGPLAFTRDAKAFFAAAGHGTLGVYEVATGRALYGIKYQGNWVSDVVPSPDGRQVYLMIQGGNDDRSLTRIERWGLR